MTTMMMMMMTTDPFRKIVETKEIYVLNISEDMYCVIGNLGLYFSLYDLLFEDAVLL